MTEREKMLAGLLYDISDKELVARRIKAHDLSVLYGTVSEKDAKRRREILKELLPHADETAWIQGPVAFDYGDNVYMGKRFFANFNFTVLDTARITIGDDVMFGPNCTVVAPIHPLVPEERNTAYHDDGTPYNIEYSRPIEIGDNCWIASSVTIVGGVKIGSGCVIGAGSVVTRDIPDGYLAVGVPCRPVRKITDADRLFNREAFYPPKPTVK